MSVHGHIRKDPLTQSERSALMAKVRAKGNRSTERRAEAALKKAHIKGWTKHSKKVPFKPDFYFPRAKLVLFIDGCFWHACPRCRRRMPHTRYDFWKAKIEGNRLRDNRTGRFLKKQGYRVMRVWEHDVARQFWIMRLLLMLGNAK